MPFAKSGVSSRLWASDACCRASLAFSNGMPWSLRKAIDSSVALALAKESPIPQTY